MLIVVLYTRVYHFLGVYLIISFFDPMSLILLNENVMCKDHISTLLTHEKIMFWEGNMDIIYDAY